MSTRIINGKFTILDAKAITACSYGDYTLANIAYIEQHSKLANSISSSILSTPSTPTAIPIAEGAEVAKTNGA